MPRVALSFNDVSANELKWLSKRTMRGHSNLFALLLNREVERHLAEMSEEDRAAAREEITGVRVVQ